VISEVRLYRMEGTNFKRQPEASSTLLVIRHPYQKLKGIIFRNITKKQGFISRY
jgi:hypothetical protein